MNKITKSHSDILQGHDIGRELEGGWTGNSEGAQEQAGDGEGSLAAGRSLFPVSCCLHCSVIQPWSDILPADPYS